MQFKQIQMSNGKISYFTHAYTFTLSVTWKTHRRITTTSVQSTSDAVVWAINWLSSRESSLPFSAKPFPRYNRIDWQAAVAATRSSPWPVAASTTNVITRPTAGNTPRYFMSDSGYNRSSEAFSAATIKPNNSSPITLWISTKLITIGIDDMNCLVYGVTWLRVTIQQ